MRLSRFCSAIAAITAFVALPSACTQPQNRTTNVAESDEPAVSSPTTSSFQISDRADDMEGFLQELNRELLSSADVAALQARIAAQGQKINGHEAETLDLLAANPNLVELEDELRYWQMVSRATATQSTILNALALRTAEHLRILQDEEPAWESTWNQLRASKGIDPNINRVRDVLNGIKETKSRTQQQLNFVIALQDQSSQQAQRISELVLEIRSMKAQQNELLLRRDGAWRRALTPSRGSGFTFTRSMKRFSATSVEFLDTHTVGLLCVFGLYGLFLIGMQKLRRHAFRLEHELGRSIALQHTFSTTLLFTLMAVGGTAASVPIEIGFIFCLLYLIPIAHLFGHTFKVSVRTVIAAFGSLYVLQVVCVFGHIRALTVRELQVVISCLGLAAFGWLIRRLRPSKGVALQALIFGSRMALLLMGSSLIAAIVGYSNLAQLITMVVIVIAFVGLGFCCGGVILNLLLEFGLQSDLSRRFVGTNTKLLSRLLQGALAVGVFLLWLRTTLQLFGLYPIVIAAVTSFFERPIQFSRLQFTIGGALSVLGILSFGFLVSKLICHLLNRVLLPRLSLERGIPFAISQITYYVLLIIVGSIALSAAGVELNRFTVLTGALGVGLGFGLQNIVNNFVSGLILLVERPVHLGDTIDVGGLVGNVRRIGSRSSTMVTYEGAEVIIPNSTLISNQMINWTLSSPWRRVDIPVSVVFGTDPETVIKLLVNVAQAHPGVLLARPPLAFFLGFGSYALNFELRFWSAEQETWFQLKSDVTIAVSKGLRAAGIEVPLPQQDIRICSDARCEETQSMKTRGPRRPDS